jgi:hypothetical protein
MHFAFLHDLAKEGAARPDKKKKRKKLENEEGERNICVLNIIFLGEVFFFWGVIGQKNWAGTKIFSLSRRIGQGLKSFLWVTICWVG